jgi:hypothetical protein
VDILARMLWWALLWFVLLVGAGLVVGLLARRLWRKAKALTSELTVASARLTEVLDAINDLAEQDNLLDDAVEAGHRPPARADGGRAGGPRPVGRDRSAGRR